LRTERNKFCQDPPQTTVLPHDPWHRWISHSIGGHFGFWVCVSYQIILSPVILGQVATE
jgi:hypothetical protein